MMTLIAIVNSSDFHGIDRFDCKDVPRNISMNSRNIWDILMDRWKRYMADIIVVKAFNKEDDVHR